MKKRSSLLVFTMIALLTGVMALALAGCSSQSSSSTSSASSSGDASSSVSVDDAQSIVSMSLDYNAGTGYEWTYTVEPEGNVTLVDQTTQNKAKDSKLAGGPLSEVFTFRAARPGEVTSTFKLARSWEDSDPAEEQVYCFAINNQLEMTLNPYKSNFVNEPEWGTNA